MLEGQERRKIPEPKPQGPKDELLEQVKARALPTVVLGMNLEVSYPDSGHGWAKALQSKAPPGPGDSSLILTTSKALAPPFAPLLLLPLTLPIPCHIRYCTTGLPFPSIAYFGYCSRSPSPDFCIWQPSKYTLFLECGRR